MLRNLKRILCQTPTTLTNKIWLTSNDALIVFWRVWVFNWISICSIIWQIKFLNFNSKFPLWFPSNPMLSACHHTPEILSQSLFSKYRPSLTCTDSQTGALCFLPSDSAYAFWYPRRVLLRLPIAALNQSWALFLVIQSISRRLMLMVAKRSDLLGRVAPQRCRSVSVYQYSNSLGVNAGYEGRLAM